MAGALVVYPYLIKSKIIFIRTIPQNFMNLDAPFTAKDARLVYGDPSLHAVTKMVENSVSIFSEVISNLWVRPTA